MTTATQMTTTTTPKLRSVRRPRVDVYSSDTELLLVADLPGVTTDGLTVQVDRNTLLVRGDRGSGRLYTREFNLPDTVDGSGITAELEHGILTVHLPRRAELQPRMIEVKSSG